MFLLSLNGPVNQPSLIFSNVNSFRSDLTSYFNPPNCFLISFSNSLLSAKSESKVLLETVHFGGELFGGDVGVFDLHVKILTRAKGIVLLFDLLVRKPPPQNLLQPRCQLKVLNDRSSSSAESRVFWFLPSFTVVPSLDASISTISPLVLVLSKNKMETFVPVVAKILLGIETTPRSIFSSTSFSRIFFSMPLCAVRKPVGTTMAALPFARAKR